MTTGDTIAAVSSAVGHAARMIVRVSGPDACRLAAAVWRPREPAHAAPAQTQTVAALPPGATRGHLSFAGMTVPGCWMYVFRAPRSYTGEDLVEFHIPGNPLLARMLLDVLTGGGARAADAGEFTARAYFNGRIDLTEAEGVAATIAAGNEGELRAARQLLAGELARRLRPVTDLVAETLALVEVGIDFADEDVTFLAAGEVADRAARADALLRDLLAQSARFERLTHEPRVALVGRPNAGKSTLLNALAGHERALTSPVAGTTRDVLTADVPLRRGLVRLTDAAGLVGNEQGDHGDVHAAGETGGGGGSAPAEIERQMYRNALRAVESADVVVLVHDVGDDRPAPVLPRQPDLIVRSKADLNRPAPRAADDVLHVSAKSGDGLDRLRETLDRLAFGASTGGGGGGSDLALNARHVRAVSEARDALARAAGRAGEAGAGGGPEILALELREALDALGRVTGAISPDDLLGRIFSSFCIGK
jgi:tRNA modification GTPase